MATIPPTNQEASGNDAGMNSPEAAVLVDTQGDKKRPDPPNWTDIANFLVSGALLICAIAAGVISYLQWDAANSQLAFARNEARDNARDTRRALRASVRLARAAEKQAQATQKALEISARLASSSERQSAAAIEELKLAQEPNIDIVAENLGGEGGIYRASFKIIPGGKYSLKGVKVEAFSNYVGSGYLIKPQKLPPMRTTTIDLVPGVPRLIFVNTPAPMNERQARLMDLGAFVVIHYIHVSFVKADGKADHVDQCIFVDKSDLPIQYCRNVTFN